MIDKGVDGSFPNRQEKREEKRKESETETDAERLNGPLASASLDERDVDREAG